MPLGVLLVQHGVFPASPTKPHVGVSLDVLDIYRAMFERSCDAIHALAAVLHTIYDRRGFTVVSERNPLDRLVDPFRRSLTQAVQWSSNLRDRIDRNVHAALDAAEREVIPPAPGDIDQAMDIEPSAPSAPSATSATSVTSASPATPSPLVPTDSTSTVDDPVLPTLTPGRASRILREHCPACFGHTEWGRSLDSGGDVQLGADGCFSYRHLRSAGDGPIGYTPSFFIPKSQIDAVAQAIALAKENPRARARLLIPQDVIDGCESTFEAANEKTQKGNSKRYDAAGVFLMTCRHGQILFFCNIYTPGEQQRYIVASLEELARHLPPKATILQAYDIGCVTDHSVNKYPILGESLHKNIRFIINHMHSYRHRWLCQLIYGPRFALGAGLTDHEDVERIWSRTRKMVPLTRSQWNSRRIWMIDQYGGFLNGEGRENLGSWIERQEKKLRTKLRAALRTFRECCVTEEELRRHWEDQKEAQMSMHSHAPARLRRELDKVLTLQTQIDGVEKAISDAKQEITGSNPPPSTVSLIRRLEATHERLTQEAEDLYASLNISNSFPDLADLPRAFAHILLIVHDLKIVIRKRAIASFQEWEELDCAVAGRREPLGTKLYQATRKAIAKRQPALLKLIGKFNDNCEKLDSLCPVGCPIPIPAPLPTTLNALRYDSSLHEDVCISPTPGGIPAWLANDDVRDGLRSLHTIDRCREEANRLNLDCANLRLWLSNEQLIVDKALASHPDPSLLLPLQERQHDLVFLKYHWSSALQHQTLPRDLPRGFHPAEAPHTPAQTRRAATLEAVDRTAAEDAGGTRNAGHGGTLQAVRQAEAEPGSGRAGTSSRLSRRFNHFVIRGGNFQKLQVEPGDLDRIIAPRGRLNGEALNGVAASLHVIYSDQYSPYAASAARCALLSTYDLTRVHFKASDTQLWRFLGPTEYWTKPLWLIPIHRPVEEHWVCAVVDVHRQSIYFFDSFADHSGWRPNLRDIMILIARMVVLSNRQGHPLHISTGDEPWTAYPMFKNHGQQTNGHDCGLWVLCTLAAVMRGFAGAEVYEGDMPTVRTLFADLIQTLPIT
ncbi:hypothetical protein B0H13DRAFT_1608630 [Mycena leptocephala]|nr:hypothetical protein B0H13DRAFT_1608630 [Mycena leptocephala]